MGYRKNASRVLGRPDVAFTRWKVAVFVDGCFWHGCPSCYRPPASNADFWSDKLIRNRTRDAEVTSGLETQGWTVVRLWEHEVRRDPAHCADRVRQALEAAGYKGRPA